MSETNVGASIPQQQAAPQQAQAAPPSAAPASPRRGTPQPQPTGWVGWILFGATMMTVLGMFHAFQGLVALFQSDYYLVGRNGLTVHVDYTAWGWTHLVLGAVVVAAGIGLFAGQTWARVVGVVLAVVSALVNVAFLAAYPVWSTIMVAVDVMVIWALTVHGAEMRAAHEGGSIDR